MSNRKCKAEGCNELWSLSEDIRGGQGWCRYHWRASSKGDWSHLHGITQDLNTNGVPKPETDWRDEMVQANMPNPPIKNKLYALAAMREMLAGFGKRMH